MKNLIDRLSANSIDIFPQRTEQSKYRAISSSASDKSKNSLMGSFDGCRSCWDSSKKAIRGDPLRLKILPSRHLEATWEAPADPGVSAGNFMDRSSFSLRSSQAWNRESDNLWISPSGSHRDPSRILSGLKRVEANRGGGGERGRVREQEAGNPYIFWSGFFFGIPQSLTPRSFLVLPFRAVHSLLW